MPIFDFLIEDIDQSTEIHFQDMVQEIRNSQKYSKIIHDFKGYTKSKILKFNQYYSSNQQHEPSFIEKG